MGSLSSNRVVLKQHSPEELMVLHKWFNDEELHYLSDDEPFETVTLESVKTYLEKRLIPCGLSKNKEIIHLAIHTVEGNFIGFCMIAYIDHYNKKCKMGLTIGEKTEWGKGYAKEAMVLLLNYAFNDLKMNRVGVEIYEFNDRSIKLFENLGFKQEGTIRKNVLKNGKYYDENVYGLLKDEWVERNNETIQFNQ